MSLLWRMDSGLPWQKASLSVVLLARLHIHWRNTSDFSLSYTLQTYSKTQLTVSHYSVPLKFSGAAWNFHGPLHAT
jgi:hypothetical protein